MPKIEILDGIKGEEAVKFAQCFPKGVIALRGPENLAEVVDARNDTVSRECFRHEEFQSKVKLGRVPDHFICKYLFYIVNIETVSFYKSTEVVLEALDILSKKCLNILDFLNTKF